jgi:small subunit ribosomal protein S14
MAKTSAVVRNERRKKLAAKYFVRRQELVKIVKNPKTTPEARAAAYAKLRAFPRNSAPVRIRNRCSMSGRPRGVEGFFGLSRIALRDMALSGLLPGVRKASW